MQNDISGPSRWTAAVAGVPARGWAGRFAGLYERYRVLIRYALVGASGYVVYLGVLTLMYDLALVPFFPAKGGHIDLLLFTHEDVLLLLTTLVGTQASIVAVFVGHSAWTFAGPGTGRKPLLMRFAQFEARALVSTLGILTVTVNGAVLAGVHYYVAVAAGLVATFAWNWLWDSKVIWRKGGTQT